MMEARARRRSKSIDLRELIRDEKGNMKIENAREGLKVERWERWGRK
jgi:hypothetical protein